MNVVLKSGRDFASKEWKAGAQSRSSLETSEHGL